MPTYRSDYSGRNQYELVLVVTLVSQSVANNTSTVRFNMYARSKQGWGSFATDSFPWIINCSTIADITGSRNLDFRPDSTGKTLSMTNVTRVISHAANGTRTLTIRGRHTTSSVFGSADTGNNTWTLPAIPKAPSAPGTPSVSSTTPVSAALAWTAPSSNGGAALTGYDIARSVNSNMSSPTIFSQGTTRTRTLTGLTPATTYYTRVRAKNAYETGPWSAIRSFTTAAAQPPGMTVTPDPSGRSAVVALTPPPGTPSTVYTVQWQPLPAQTPTGSIQDITPIEVSPLAPGQAYRWRASALLAGGGGQSPWTDWVTVVQPQPNTIPGEYFDGSTPAREDVTFDWVGTANNSESEATGISPLGWEGTSSVQRVAGGRSGAYFARQLFFHDTEDAQMRTVGAVVSSGGTYVASVYARPSRPINLVAGVEWVDENGDPLGEDFGPPREVTSTTGWTRIVSGPLLAPPGAEGATLILASPDEWLGGDTLDADDAMISIGGLAPYFSGDTPDTPEWVYEWLGDPNESASWALARDVEDVDPLADPDCPPPPVPPRPPAIVDDCIIEVGTWRRYWAIVPAEQVPQWLDVIPTFILRSQALPERQVRIRVFANPGELDPDDFTGEDWISEQIISYMPAATVITLDAVSRRVWASVDGGEEIPADRLLYGTGGRPASWPTLSCGIGYLIAFDVPEDAPDGNLQVDVALTTRSL